jgi:hypothetical protein
MSRTQFSQRLILEGPDLVRVHLRGDLDAVEQKQGEVILDINRSGNWVRGFEIVGGFVPFSISKAVSPFNPVRPNAENVALAGTATYDPEADAAFFYLEYAPDFGQLTPQEQAYMKVVSHSVSPTALFGLDDSGGVVWIKIPIADAGPANQFLRLLRK